MGLLFMSDKERLRKAHFEMVKLSKITLVIASIQCSLSYRQAIRLYHRYLLEGDPGLIHKARGRLSNHRHAERKKIISLYKEKYEGFGPTLASEKLEEDDNFIVDHETLRGWLLEEKLWHRQRKRQPYRQRRECRAQFGELVQLDGSIHDWLEEGRKTCLLNMVDDATSKSLSYLDTGETTRSIFIVLWRWIERYGVPLAAYVDLKSVYVSSKQENFTHVQRACSKLGIRIIKAYSPQAKGRVERNHGVYQDRFVKELRLKKIKKIEQANEVLEGGFIDKLNQKFEKLAKNPVSAHRPLDCDLNQILCWEYKRHVQNDWTFSFKNKCYQIKKSYGDTVKPKVEIYIRKHLDGSISAWYKDKRLSIKELEARPKMIELQLPKNVIKLKLEKTKSPWSISNTNVFKTTDHPKGAKISNIYKISRCLVIPKNEIKK
jgi:hypothetical protein